MMSEPILIIGATGTVGSELVRQLAAQGQTTRAATRNPEQYAPTAHVAAVRFDYDDPTTFASTLDGVRRMFLLAMPADTHADVRLIRFIDAAQQAGVQHIALMTAMGVDQADTAPLRKVEKYIEAIGVAYTFLRPNWFMQNFYPGFLYPTIRSHGAFYLPAEDARVSFISARDIAAVTTTVFTQPGHTNQAYTLTGSEALSHTEVATILSEAAGCPIRYVAVSDEDMRRELRESGWGAAETEYMVALFVALRTGYAAPVSPNVERILGRKPITLRAFAEEHAMVWRA